MQTRIKVRHSEEADAVLCCWVTNDWSALGHGLLNPCELLHQNDFLRVTPEF
jgi:hypothetical protein